MSGKAAVVVILLLVLAAGAAGYYFLVMKGGGAGPLPAEAMALPAETTLAGGVDVKALFASIRKVLDGDFGGLPVPPDAAKQLPEAKQQFEKGLAEAEAKIGIKLDRDIDQVVIGGWNFEGKDPRGAAVIVGRFDKAKIGTAVEALMKEQGKTPTTRDVKGVKVYVADDGAFAVPNDRVIVVGHAQAVDALVSNVVDGKKALGGNANLVSLSGRLASKTTFWVVGSEGFVNALRGQMGGAPFALPKSFTLAESAGALELVAQMPDDKAASSLAEMMKGQLAMAKQMQGPEAAAMKNFSPEISASGSDLRLSLKMTGGEGAMSAGAIAAIAIPSLLRARSSANEAQIIGDLRTIISAEITYSSMESAGGGFGSLECMAEPTSCTPPLPAGSPKFIDASAIAPVKGGYQRTFHPGPPGAVEGTLASFAVTAVPVTPGQTGIRSFCADNSGVICVNADGAPFDVEGGVCPSGCTPLD